MPPPPAPERGQDGEPGDQHRQPRRQHGHGCGRQERPAGRDAQGLAVPQLRPEDADMPLGPWVDPANFNPGYLARSMHLMPKQGAHEPWRWGADYTTERQQLADADLDDGRLRFTS